MIKEDSTLLEEYSQEQPEQDKKLELWVQTIFLENQRIFMSNQFKEQF